MRPVTGPRIELPDGQTRYFNGHVSDFSQTGNDGDFAVYHATLRPWLWFLTQTSDCRIYQHKTVPEIIKDIFRGQGFSDFEERLSLDYHPWNYRVLYRDSYFNFICRLMEQEGIYYYFEHDKGKHTLILADNYASLGFIPGHETLPYYPPNTVSVRDGNFISRWGAPRNCNRDVLPWMILHLNARKRTCRSIRPSYRIMPIRKVNMIRHQTIS